MLKLTCPGIFGPNMVFLVCYFTSSRLLYIYLSLLKELIAIFNHLHSLYMYMCNISLQELCTCVLYTHVHQFNLVSSAYKINAEFFRHALHHIRTKCVRHTSVTLSPTSNVLHSYNIAQHY